MTDLSLGPIPAHLDFAGLTQALLHWADRQPDEPAVILLADGERETGRMSYAELATSAGRLAGAFVEQGLSGKPLLLPAQTSLEFVRGFYAALFAGVTAVPVATQSRGPAAERLRAVATSCGAAAVLDVPGADALFEVLPDVRRIGLSEGAIGKASADLDERRIALLQYTSGSTSEPRGVEISAANLASNSEQTRHGYRVRPESRMLSWLPLFHDMGLISVFSPLWSGIGVVLMPPLAFLQRPQRWAIAIDRYDATLSGGPDFAFNLCAARAEPALAAGIDLSRWDVAFCGSEPVRRSTLRRFAEAYAPAGFDPKSLYPCYGLAEATVFVSGGAWNPEAGDGPVSCGPPGLGTTVRIVGGEGNNEPVAEGETGEIWVRGAQVAGGYLNAPEATEATFQGRLRGDSDTYLRTGDVGVIRDGEIYVLGRIKDILIHRGATIHAADVETVAATSHPAVAEAPGAAFAIEHADREAVVLVQEVGRRFARLDDLTPITVAIEDSLALGYALRPHELMIVRPGTLPRTASGKVRRGEVRRAYLAGELEPRRLVTTGAPT